MNRKNEIGFGCVKNTIKLRSGSYFDFVEPKPDQFTFGDIAGALAKICRFGGQCPYFYSVAEHSVICAKIAIGDGLPIEFQRAALMHDAAEAFVGDIVKPLKIMLDEFKNIETLVEWTIAEKFRIDFTTTKEAVREIDHAVLIGERKALFGGDGVVWFGENEVRKLDLNLERLSWARAEVEFTRMAQRLGIKIL